MPCVLAFYVLRNVLGNDFIPSGLVLCSQGHILFFSAKYLCSVNIINICVQVFVYCIDVMCTGVCVLY